ncbi:MAG: hypothetical protein IJ940_00770, partial [Bacteroidales bacterium]|nr:hypothetical protein [Bacteroidales bacterium]
VSARGVTVNASDDAGEFYAMQTLHQMTGNGKYKEIRCRGRWIFLFRKTVRISVW